MKVQAIIPTAGLGVRLKSEVPKPFVLLKEKPLFIHTLESIERSSFIESIIFVCSGDCLAESEKLVKSFHLQKVKKIVAGGSTRKDSVYNGLQVLDNDTDIVLIHDGARPFVLTSVIDESIRQCEAHDAVIVAVPVKPTIKRVDGEDLFVKETLERNKLWEVQTPQVFRSQAILKAHEQGREKDVTDDASLVEDLGVRVKILPGDYGNIKITTQEDLVFAEALQLATMEKV